MNSLLDKHCRDYSEKEASMNNEEIERFLVHTPDWQHNLSTDKLSRTFGFENYPQTMQFVNQVATIAEAQNHHPIMQVSYNRCKVSYSTHTVKGITENDFICAAKIDALLN